MYLRHHLRAFLIACRQFLKAPFSTVMTLGVIGIAFALPLALWILLFNVKVITEHWDDSAQISLYLKQNISETQTQKLVEKLRQRSDISKINYISPDQALDEFEKQTGLSDVLDALDKNPLPPVVEVTPALSLQTPEDVRQLLANLQHLPEVEKAQLDMEWVKRLYGIIDLGERVALTLGILLSMAVLLIIGNTIRLMTQTAKTEIKIIQLVGATRAFARRPFLYIGFLYGLGGGMLGWLLTSLMLDWLEAPAQQLAALYHSNYQISGLDDSALVLLLITSSLLGIIASRAAVSQYLE